MASEVINTPYGPLAPEVYAQLSPGEKAWLSFVERRWKDAGRPDECKRVIAQVILTPQERNLAISRAMAEKAARLGLLDEFLAELEAQLPKKRGRPRTRPEKEEL